MSSLTAVGRLERLQRSLTVARSVEASQPDHFTAGLNAGLQIALRAVEQELQFARDAAADGATNTN